MATIVTVLLRFQDGGMGYLQNSDVTTGTAGEEIKTSNATTLLNQVEDVSAGQAFNNRVVTHAVAKAVTQGAATASLMWCAIRTAQGTIEVPIQGGGGNVGEFPKIYKATRLTTGMTVHAAWQAGSDSATLFGSLTVCTARKCDIFFAQGSDAAAVELLNSSGSTIGQSMQGTTSAYMWGTYPGSPGVNNQGAGESSQWVTDAQGQLKALVPPTGHLNQPGGSIASPVSFPVQFTQNDSAYLATDT